MLAGATLGQMIGVTPAVHAIFGVVLIPLSHQFGWSRTSISVGLALLSLVCMVAYPAIGRFADRAGAWRVATFGCLFFAPVLASGAWLTGALWQYDALYVALAIGATLVNPTLFLKMVSETHARDFGFAAGFSGGIGVGGGYALATLLGSVLLTRFGWRGAYLGIAVFVLVIGLFSQLVLLRSVGRAPSARPQAEPAPLDAAGYIATPDFWLILFGLVLMAGMTMAVIAHLIAILAGHGISSATAARIVATCTLILLPWQPICGALADRFGLRVVLVPYLVGAAGLLLLLVSDNWIIASAACLACTIGCGAQFCVIPKTVQRHFGLQNFTAIMGLLYIALFVGEGIGPVILDMVYDQTGSYRSALIGWFGFTLLGAGTVWALAIRPPRLEVVGPDQGSATDPLGSWPQTSFSAANPERTAAGI